MKTRQESVKEKLASIRAVLDADVVDVDIISVQNKMINLTQMSGLSAECVASSVKLLEQNRLKVLNEIKDSGYPASIMSKMIDANSSDQLALLKYADRINAAVTHSIDGLRSVISLYKEELSNNLKS